MKTWMKKGFIAWISILALMGTANAGFLFEPFAGYDFSLSGELTDSVGTKTKLSWSNFEVGGRLGYIFKWIGLGVEYDWKNPKWKWDDGFDTEQKYDMSNFGAFLGLYLGHRSQWMIRGKYIFIGKATTDDISVGAPVSLELKGTGYGVDLGYRFIDWLAINVEYTMNTFDEIGGVKTGDEIKTSDILVSVSFPLEFPSRQSRR